MLKKLFELLIAASCLTMTISAQESKALINAFDSEKAVWTYLSCMYCDIEEPTIHKTVLYGDTIIDGIKWKIVTEEKVKGLVRVDGNKVLYKPYLGYEGILQFADHEDPFNYDYSGIIYDFSLEIGDRIMYKGLKTTILEIDSIKLNDGNRHKRLINEYGGSYVEGLGSTNHSIFFHLLPQSTCQCDATTIFICCHVNDKLLYINPDYLDCDGNWVNNVIINDNSKVKVYFVDGIIHIVHDNNNSFDVTIYSMQGTFVAQKNNNYNVAIIPLKNMAKGVYFIRIISDKQTLTHKIVKYE